MSYFNADSTSENSYLRELIGDQFTLTTMRRVVESLEVQHKKLAMFLRKIFDLQQKHMHYFVKDLFSK